MSEWQETTLGEEVNLITGFPFKSSQYTDNENDIPLIRGDNIVQGRLRWDGVKRWPVDDTTIDESYKLREGDVVLAMDRPWIEAGLKFAVISRFDLPCYLVQRVACLRGKEQLCSVFLRYLIASKDFTQHILSVETGSAVPHISGSQIKEFIFQRPPLEEQKSIASVLSSLDDKIDLLHRQNKTLEAVAETLFRQWFVEGAGDWEIVKLGEVADVGWGDTNTTKSSYVEAGYLAYSATGPDGFMDHYDFDKAGIVVSAIGANCGKIWFANGKWSCIKNTIRIFSNDSLVSEEYLYFLLNKPDGWPIRGSAQPFISQTDARNIDIPYPSKDKSLAFNGVCRPVFSKIAKNIEQIKTIEKLRDVLLPKLMSGEVRVS